MSFWSKVREGYSNIDKLVGGYLPGGVKPGATKTTPTPTPTPTPTQQKAPSTSGGGSSSSGGGSSSSGGGSSSSGGGSSSSGGGSSSTVNVLKSGGVKSGNVTYHGKAIVPGTNKTANQLQNETFAQARTQGINKRGTYSATINYTQQPTQQTQTIQPIQQTQTIQPTQTNATSKVLVTGLYADKPKEQYFRFDNKKASPEYDTGILTVLPENAENYRKAGKPVWVLESNNLKDYSLESSFIGGTTQINRNVNTRGLYEYNTQQIIAGKDMYHKYKTTISDFESSPEKFKGKPGVTTTTTTKGTVYQLTPEYFNKNIDTKGIYKNALVKTKTEFNRLPPLTKTKLNIAGYGQGGTSAVIGVAEFSNTLVLNMGVQTYTPEQIKEGGLRGRTFKFGGDLGKMRSYPSTQSTTGFLENPINYVRQKGTSPEFLGQATVMVPLAYKAVTSTVQNIKELGFKGGVTETASGLSPIRMKSNIYSEPITSKTKFTNVKSIKGTVDGVTTKVYSGSSGTIKLSGVEKSTMINGKNVGAGYSITKTPFIEVRGGGAIVTEGVRTTVNPYSFSSTGTGTAYRGVGNNFMAQITSNFVKGGTSNIYSNKGFTIYQTPKTAKIYSSAQTTYKIQGGGASQNVKKGVTAFSSGTAKPIYKTTYTGDKTLNLNEGTLTRDFIHAPTGRVRLSPKMSGVEYDLNKLMGQGGGLNRYTSSRSGGTATATITQLETPGVKASIPITKPITSTYTTAPIPPQTTTQTKVRQSSQYAGLGTYEKTTGGTTQLQIAKPGTTPINIFRPKTQTINLLVSKTKIRTGTKQRQTVIPSVVAIPTTRPAQKQKAITTTKIISVQKVRVPQTQKYATTTPFNYESGANTYNPYTPPSPLPIGLPVGYGGGMFSKIGNVKAGRTRTKYTPSFKALFFKIKGKAPSGVKTGLNFRPITPGFSFTNKKRIIKVRRIKL